MTTQILSPDVSSLAKEGRTAFTVWITLSAITLMAWLFAPSHDFGADHRSLLVAVIAFLGFLKSMLVADYFMELRHAPRWLRVSVQGWMAALWVSLLVIYYAF